MCGIISVLSFDTGIEHALISALERLEYRGYDSAGIAYVDIEFELHRIRSVGKISNLSTDVSSHSINAKLGIGHTRWATHGKVTKLNAHPHVSGNIAIVHNGIVENYQDLKNMLTSNGIQFESETDSEVIAKLLDYNTKSCDDFLEAFKKTIRSLRGTYAIVAISSDHPEMIYGAKKGSPMAIGMSSDARSFYIASDAIALSSLSEDIAYLEEGDIVVANRNDSITFKIFDSNDCKVTRQFLKNNVSLSDVSTNGFDSFMLKEIHEEVDTVINTYNNFEANIKLKDYKSITIIACGTSYYAGILAKYWIEEISGIRTNVEIASEFRYRNPVLEKDGLYVFISQSGETIDTLCALRQVKEFGAKTLSIINVESSSIARESDMFIKTYAGTEIGVASTKAFVAQILTMLLLCIEKDKISITELSGNISYVLSYKDIFKKLANNIKNSKSLFYIGRGRNYPIALEGALKIKELSYISAEGYPSGEIKHGPIAIIDEDVYTIAIAPFDNLFEKTISNTQEILARGGKVLVISTEQAIESLRIFESNQNVTCVFLKSSSDLYNQFAITTAIHLLAYYTALSKGYDVDKPRNLAKSVTVE